jgi:hypothetical protein
MQFNINTVTSPCCHERHTIMQLPRYQRMHINGLRGGNRAECAGSCTPLFQRHNRLILRVVARRIRRGRGRGGEARLHVQEGVEGLRVRDGRHGGTPVSFLSKSPPSHHYLHLRLLTFTKEASDAR